MKLSPSDFLLASILYGMVEEGRENRATLNRDHTLAMKIMCFLSDTLQDTSTRVNFELSNIRDTLSFLPADCTFLDSCISDINFRTVDNLMDFIPKVSSVFDDPPATSQHPNKVFTLNKLCKTSFLGLYVRFFLAQWESTVFEEVCSYFDSIRAFVSSLQSSQPTSVDSAAVIEEDLFSLSNIEILRGPMVASCGFLEDELSRIESFVAAGDVHSAEALIHKYFDNTMPNILATAQPGIGASAQSSSSRAVPDLLSGCMGAEVASVIHSLMSAQTSNVNAGYRHQQAMLALADTWVRNGFTQRGLTCVEEAMKMAHQKGDRGSVAKALLILHKIVKEEDRRDQLSRESSLRSGGEGVVSGLGDFNEIVLMKCLDSCIAARMPALTSQVAILLARHRIIAPLRFETWEQAVSSDSPAITGDHHNLENIWALLIASRFGVPAVTGRIAHLGNDLTPQQKTIEVPHDSLILPSRLWDSMRMSCDLAEVDLLIRLNLLDLAKVRCEGSMRQLTRWLKNKQTPYMQHFVGNFSRGNVEEVCFMLSRYAKILLEEGRPWAVMMGLIEARHFPTPSIGSTADSAEANMFEDLAAQVKAARLRVDEALQIARFAKSFDSYLTPAGRYEVDKSGFVLLVWQALLHKNWSLALRRVAKLTEITKDAPSHHDFPLSAAESQIFDHVNFSQISDVEARLMHALCVLAEDVTAGESLLRELSGPGTDTADSRSPSVGSERLHRGISRLLTCWLTSCWCSKARSCCSTPSNSKLFTEVDLLEQDFLCTLNAEITACRAQGWPALEAIAESVVRRPHMRNLHLEGPALLLQSMINT